MSSPCSKVQHKMGLDLRRMYSKKTKEKKTREPRSAVILDVGGERFSATRSPLLNSPASRLGKLMRAETIEKILEQCDEFIPGEVPEYFFDKVSELDKERRVDILPLSISIHLFTFIKQLTKKNLEKSSE